MIRRRRRGLRRALAYVVRIEEIVLVKSREVLRLMISGRLNYSLEFLV